jgi:hypothetical protein
MTKMKTIDKAALHALRPRIDAALKALGEELGIAFAATSGSYGDNSGHFKLTIAIDDPALQEAAARREFNSYCQLFDLLPEDFGREVQINGKAHRVSGLALNRSKFPIKMIEVATGKEMLFSEKVVPRIVAQRAIAGAN